MGSDASDDDPHRDTRARYGDEPTFDFRAQREDEAEAGSDEDEAGGSGDHGEDEDRAWHSGSEDYNDTEDAASDSGSEDGNEDVAADSDSDDGDEDVASSSGSDSNDETEKLDYSSGEGEAIAARAQYTASGTRVGPTTYERRLFRIRRGQDPSEETDE